MQNDSAFTMVHRDGKIYRKGVKLYPNLDRYKGEFIQGRREGLGLLTYANGTTYDGEWTNNLFHGHGTFTSFDFSSGTPHRGQRYEGEYEFGRKHGKGLQHLIDGSVYDGAFANNLFEGDGSLRTKAGDILKGLFSKGKLIGSGRIAFANGDSYKGELQGGRFHGTGTYTYSTGGTYNGSYKHGEFHGAGTRVFSSGSIYSGNFADGVQHGEGMLHWANNDQYVGMWRRDLPDGRGVFMFGHGDRFEGLFSGGAFCGRGRYSWSDGGYYEGAYLDKGRKASTKSSGLRNGYGVRWWVSGNCYEGEWLDDKMEGSGKFITADNGPTYTGEVKANRKHGKGREQWGNQLGIDYRCGMGFKHKGRGFCRYDGCYINGAFDGEGFFGCIDGRSYEGQWSKGARSGFGRQVLCPAVERGDRTRAHIGGTMGLYRALKYVGGWLEDKREGHGLLELMNGQTLKGYFLNGFIDGHVLIKYPDGRKDTALFERGSRVGWTDTNPHFSKKNWADIGIDRAAYREVGRSASPWTLTGSLREADLSWLPKRTKQRRMKHERLRFKKRLSLAAKSFGAVKTAELDLDAVEVARGVVDARDKERRENREVSSSEGDRRTWAAAYAGK